MNVGVAWACRSGTESCMRTVRRCIPSLLAPPLRSALAEKGGFSASIQLKAELGYLEPSPKFTLYLSDTERNQAHPEHH